MGESAALFRCQAALIAYCAAESATVDRSYGKYLNYNAIHLTPEPYQRLRPPI